MPLRTFLLAALVAVSMPTLAEAAEKIRAQLSWISTVQYADHWIAQEKELFAKRGLEVEFLAGGPNAPKALVTVAAGQADIGYTNWQSFLEAVRLGNDYVLIGAPMYGSPMGIISLKKKPIREPKDLVDAKILAQGPHEKSLIEAVLKMSNLPADQWTMVPAGYSPEPLLAGDGDGYTAYATNQAITLQMMGMKLGEDFYFTSFDDLGFSEPGEVIFTTRDYLNSHHDAVVAYMASLIEGWRLNVEDPEYGAKLAVEKYGKDYGLDIQQQIKQNEMQMSFRQEPYYELSLDRVTGPMAVAAKAAGHELPQDVGSLIAPEVVSEAYKQLD